MRTQEILTVVLALKEPSGLTSVQHIASVSLKVLASTRFRVKLLGIKKELSNGSLKM